MRDLVVGFGDQIVLDHLSLDVRARRDPRLRRRLGQRQVGAVAHHHRPVAEARTARSRCSASTSTTANEHERRAIERRWGVLFQQGALFSSLTVRAERAVPDARESRHLAERLMDEIALAKLEMVGLTRDDADKFPSELSGGMTKRVALARALALDPEIVFLDEPTSGLDPISAGDFDALIRTLQQTLGLTVFMVTHDLESLLHGLRPHRRAGRRQGRGLGPMCGHAGIRASLGEDLFPGQARREARCDRRRQRLSRLRRRTMETRARYTLIGAVHARRDRARASASSTGSRTRAASRERDVYRIRSRTPCRAADRLGGAVQRHPRRRGDEACARPRRAPDQVIATIAVESGNAGPQPTPRSASTSRD